MEKNSICKRRCKFLLLALLICMVTSTFIPESLNFNYKLVFMILMVFLTYYMVIEFKMAGTAFVCAIYASGVVAVAITTGFSEYHTNAVMAFQVSIIISVLYLYSYVTKNDIAQKNMYRNSIIDDVTQTYNKRYFNIKLIEEYEHAIMKKDRFAIMVIDIDAFKSVNDRFGHAFGDKLLRAFAREIVSCIRAEDTFFRYGGDEFVMLIRKYTDESLGTINVRINNSIDAVNRKFIKDLDNSLSVSIGLAVFPDDSLDIQELFSMADKAMYEAKEYDETKILRYRAV